jgi:hypothetical protein
MPTNMINYLRYALYLALIVVSLAIYQAWDKEHPLTPVATTDAQTTVGKDYIPSVSESNTAAATSNSTVPIASSSTLPATLGQIIHVTTDGSCHRYAGR